MVSCCHRNKTNASINITVNTNQLYKTGIIDICVIFEEANILKTAVEKEIVLYKM